MIKTGAGFVCGIVVGSLSNYAFETFSKYDKALLEQEDILNWKSERKDNANLRSILKTVSPQQSSTVRNFSSHVLEYNFEKKIPIWVAEYITKETLKGEASRKNCKFKPDPYIPALFTADNSDYLGSGWSRGHMTPAGDHKQSQDSMKETFYLSNIVPQNYENNNGFWNRFEIYCRELTTKFSDVWVVSGPAFLPIINGNGKKVITYEVIGKNEVAVPTHLFKIVVTKKYDKLYAGSFIVPNQPIGYSHNLTEYQVPLDVVEKIVGVKFLSELDRSNIGNLCAEDGCKLMNKIEFESMILMYQIKSSKTSKHLKKLLEKSMEKGTLVTAECENLYNSKLKELQEKEFKILQDEKVAAYGA